jgi:hypothetical protein
VRAAPLFAFTVIFLSENQERRLAGVWNVETNADITFGLNGKSSHLFF